MSSSIGMKPKLFYHTPGQPGLSYSKPLSVGDLLVLKYTNRHKAILSHSLVNSYFVVYYLRFPLL